MVKPKRRAERNRRVDFLAEIAAGFNVKLPTESVCVGHTAPGHILDAWIFERPDVSVLHGPRGGGKSFLRAWATHFVSMQHSAHGTRILGGALAQSKQVYNALRSFERTGVGNNVFRTFNKQEAVYTNDSVVSILAASTTSVRGPHVPDLCLDEVDEIAPEIRDAALGMCMEINGVSPSVSLLSTWHRIAGPMEELINKGRSGLFPVWTYCVFDVLERCPTSRSGKNLEKCPDCPLVQWCHSGCETFGGIPKAKRSNGHYSIASLIQKVKSVSLRVFESDYLCLRPLSDGIWFTKFDQAKHVTDRAEYNPDLRVHVSTDCGVYTGAVYFQIATNPISGRPIVTVFADYLSYDVGAAGNAEAQKRIYRERCNHTFETRRPRTSMDSAGGARNPVGVTIVSEYVRSGFEGSDGIERWPKYSGSVQNSLALVEGLLLDERGEVSLLIHPRCQHLIGAMLSYRRKKTGGQWLDSPEDPQHPHEDLVDALRGGLAVEFPRAMEPEPNFHRVHASRVF